MPLVASVEEKLAEMLVEEYQAVVEGSVLLEIDGVDGAVVSTVKIW